MNGFPIANTEQLFGESLSCTPCLETRVAGNQIAVWENTEPAWDVGYCEIEIIILVIWPNREQA